MLNAKSVSVFVGVVVCAALTAPDVNAQSRRGGGGAMGRAAARAAAPRAAAPRTAAPRTAVPRSTAPINRGYYPTRVAPRFASPYLYRPYSRGYRPGLSVGFYSGYGYPYRYRYYGSPYDPYYNGYAYNYPYANNYYAPYRYTAPGYVRAVPGYSHGGVRIEGAPQDAQVFVNGHYVGRVDDFDGAFQRLNLRSGPQHIEIRAPGLAPVSFNVNVLPGQTITYHAGMR